jgi:hypothetical protein
MPIIVSEPPPIEVPTGIDHYEFFAALLDSAVPQKGTRRRVTPPKEEDFPRDAPEWMWRCFFVAARAMVARHTPGLLGLWDIRSGQLTSALINAPEDWAEEYDNTGLDALKDLLTIMVHPEAAKPGLKGTTFVQIFDGVQKAFKHCKHLRQRLPARAKYESMRKHPAIAVPKTALPTDSPEFYRLALGEVLGTGEDGQNTYRGELFNADSIQDHHLRKCLPEWKRPAEAALTLLSQVTGNTVDYLRKTLSERRTATKTRLKRVPPPME